MKNAKGDVQDRRQRVLALRLRRLTEGAIAAILSVSEATVSRDLHWIHEHWKDQYGTPAGLDPSEAIGEAMALYEDAETAALLEYHTLKESAAQRKISPMFISRQRMACLRTAMAARQLRVNLLQDLGLLERKLGSVNVHSVARADELRALLREEGLLPDSRQQAVPATDAAEVEGDEVARWLQRSKVM